MTDVPRPPASNAYSPSPNLVYATEYGANPRQNALNYQQAMNEQQNKLNNKHGGRRTKRMSQKTRRPRSHRSRRGGGTKVEVPSFPTVGPRVSPISNTQNSLATNEAMVQAQVNACNDCYATGTCATTPGCPQQGGKRGAYRVSHGRTRKSPFKSVSDVKQTLRRYKKGKKIGFSRKSSLRAMGLIPRKSGKYMLSKKYKNL
jgi:hypothetical protein